MAVYNVNAFWRWTVRDFDGNVVREFTSEDGDNGKGTDEWKWAKDYVWRGGLLLASRQPVIGTTTVTVYHYHLDHLGTPRRLTNDSDQIVGYHDYFPYGPETTGGKSEPSLTVFKYTALERDVVAALPDELDYVHARYYSPLVGRFLSPDPIQGEVAKPSSWNRYAYAGSNPLRYIDPTGLTLYAATTEAQNDICALIGPNCSQYVKFDPNTGKVTITASQAALAANDALKLFYEMSNSQKVYGAWVGTQMPTAGGKTIVFADKPGAHRVLNLSTNLRTDVPAATQYLPPTGFDGAVGLFVGYSPRAKGPNGIPAYRPLVLFHELAENFHRTENMKQYKEAHPYAIAREHVLKQQQPHLQQYTGWGPFTSSWP